MALKKFFLFLERFLFPRRFLFRWQQDFLRSKLSKAFAAGRVPSFEGTAVKVEPFDPTIPTSLRAALDECPDIYVSDFGLLQVVPNRFIKAPETRWQNDDNETVTVPGIFALDYPWAVSVGKMYRAWDRSFGGWVYYRAA